MGLHDWAGLKACTTCGPALLMRDHCVGPRNEVFPVRPVGVPAIVLPPGKLSAEEADVYRRHLLRVVVVGRAEISRAEQPEYRTRRDRRHVAALMVEPSRIALFGNAVTDKGRPRRT